MGRLIKNHLARLIVMTAAAYQIAASLEGFFWPKIFWDFLTRNFDGAVKPIPVLQSINLVCGLIGLAYEWPLSSIAGSRLHRSIEWRIFMYTTFAFAAALLYQATNPAIYYMIGVGVYFWAYTEGEIVCEKPWQLPKKSDLRGASSRV